MIAGRWEGLTITASIYKGGEGGRGGGRGGGGEEGGEEGREEGGEDIAIIAYKYRVQVRTPCRLCDI